ncbi:MAG: ABC transporter ATP-binding protein [Sphingobacteriia bacterium]|nr:ABC transporter ATP-binding protein [Sphingobacteriia bacterium]NCC39443.1 ABC transporter ATP-binding protein [Gammaproteobacteria bacterium]
MGVLVVANLSKAYKRYPGKWARTLEWLTGHPRHEKTWVLRDINFRVEPGESVGIVGVNGAGKSTLLKIITGTTRPSSGEVRVDGRIAALLELGMGFHPDFTGRQNVLIAGQLLGLHREEIGTRFGEIEDFAEIGEYIDRTVRTYSSGMQMRLAFSVATAVRPDVLIVDEALAVGDAYFQHKCFARIRRFREQGTTLLIVSHDKSAIQTLCDRAILLEDGVVIRDGPPMEVMDFYNAIIAEKENATVEVGRLQDGRAVTRSGTGEARVESVTLLDEQDRAIEFVNVGQALRLKIQIQAYQELPELTLGYMIKDRLGQTVFGTNTYHLGEPITNLLPGDRRTYVFAFPANLGPGSYSISTALHTQDNHLAANYEWRDLALIFNVINIDRDYFIGVNWIPPEVIVEE